VSLIAVVNVKTEVGYSIQAEQTFEQAMFPELTRMDDYLDQLQRVRPHLPAQIRYLAVDGAYAHQSFVTGVVALKLDVISRLRRDANLRFLFEGQQKARGARRKYAGKVKLADSTWFTWVRQLQPGVDLFTQVVWHVSLKRQIRLAYLQDTRKPNKPSDVVLFSTDVQQSPDQIYQFYKLRFQIEFLFRDAKQFTGLCDCQSPNVRKLDFHFTASFTALNLAKLAAAQANAGQHPLVFSMASIKRRALNDHLLDRFISKLALSPTAIKSHPNYESLRSYGVIAA
jgi:Transposase DDE domain